MSRLTAAKLYDRDYYTWALNQAEALRDGRFEDLDLPNLIDEVEDMARSEARQLESRMEVLLVHLLKWVHEPESRSKSWRLTVEEQRLRIGKLLKQNPGLKPKAAEIMRDAYETARLQAARETALQKTDFPSVCPWTFEQAIDDGFWPEVAGEGNGKHAASPRQRRGRRRT
ncbi:MAG: DUF29 domain-containing protein [Candidatus Binataceae bacterium]